MGGIDALPEGPVTIMFTDIEGSTALRTSLGDADTDALFRRHDELVREQIRANNGHDQGAALGDGFLAVFASTRRAVSCAIGVQRALDSFNRSRPGPPLNVRIGLNTGEVAWQDGQLSGEAVHAAARVCAAGSGGQILVSDVTRQLAGTIPDVTFHDAGEFQLKGFPTPWRLWDVVWVRETSALPEQVFVGRQTEIAHLRERLSSALKGSGGFVLVGGEPGVGKTTLVKQLILEAEQRGALAVFGRCYESEGTVPYSPFVEMLEQALRLMPADIVREDLGEDAPEVARLVPELRRRFPDIAEPVDLPPEQQRRYFFNAVGSFVARGATRFPLLLVMDDVHWADEPTLLLIEYMASLCSQLRVLGVGTYRDVELDVSRPLAASMERLVRARLVDRISLKRFDRATVATMLEALSGKAAPDAVVRAVFDETEGNPFFVEEVFRHLMEEGKLLQDGEFRSDISIDELDVPESVRLVVGRRLERLGEDARRVLAAGAVVGRGFPFRLLEEITDIDPGRLIDIVEDAEAARLIVPEERVGEIYYSFAHELIRQTLLAGLSLLRRQRIHLAVADAIERIDKRARLERPSEIANHLMQAGAAADTERTLEYLDLSADRALASAAFEEVLRAVDDALSVLGEPSGLNPEERLRATRLKERRGWAVRALGRFEECISIWEEVVSAYTEYGLVEEAAALCWEIAYQRVWLSQFVEAFASYERGQEILGDARIPLRARLISGSSAVLGLGGFAEAADDRLAEAEAIGREVGDEQSLGYVEWARTVTNWSNGRLPEGIASGQAAIDLLRRCNDQWTLVDALAWASYPLVFSGQAAAGCRLAEEASELGARLGHQGGEILGIRGVGLGWALGNTDLDSLEKRARYDLERFDAIRSPWICLSHAWLASIALLRGNLDEAFSRAEDAVAVEPVSAFSGIGWCYKLLSRAYGHDVDSCRALLDEQRDRLSRPSDRPSMGPAMVVLAATSACAVAGLTDEADALYPIVRPIVDQLPISLFDMVLSERVAGMSAAAGQRWDVAERHFTAALRQAKEFPDRLEEPQVNHWFGKMLLDRGRMEDAERGRRMVGEALEAYKAIGMRVHAAMAEEVLRR